MKKKKSADFNKDGIESLANDKPRGRVEERLKEHLPSGPDPVRGGKKVVIDQKSSIGEALKTEARSIKRSQPPQNRKGK
jgi:hypothetical protein